MSIEKTINKKTVFNGKIVNLIVKDVELPNGKITKREVVLHKKGVGIVASDGEYIYLVKQFRTAIEQEILEIPAGLLEPGEDPIEAARRELQEEIGMNARNIEPLCNFYTSVGFTDEVTYIYLATDLYSSKLPEDEDESIEVIKLPINEIDSFIDTSKTQDGKTALGLSLFKIHEKPKPLRME